MKIIVKTTLLDRLPLVESEDGIVKIKTIGQFTTAPGYIEITGDNVGAAEDASEGILGATATVGSVEIGWANRTETGVGASTAQFECTAPSEVLPAPGSYTTTLIFNRMKDGEIEELAIPGVTVVVE